MRLLTLASVLLACPAVADEPKCSLELIGKGGTEVREFPGPTERLLGSLLDGEPIERCGERDLWVLVRTPEVTGWVPIGAVRVIPKSERQMLASVPEGDPEPKKSTQCEESVVTGDAVGLHADPDRTGAPVAKLARGSAVLACRPIGDSIGVVTASGDGFVARGHVRGLGRYRREFLGLEARTVCRELFWGGVVVEDGDGIYTRVGRVLHRIGELGARQEVNVLRASGGWLLVVRGPERGWVRAETIKMNEVIGALDPGGETSTQCPKKFVRAEVFESTVVLRSLPQDDSTEVATLRTGQKLAVLGQQGTWAQVSWLGQRAWARRSALHLGQGDRLSFRVAAVEAPAVEAKPGSAAVEERLVALGFGAGISVTDKWSGPWPTLRLDVGFRTSSWLDLDVYSTLQAMNVAPSMSAGLVLSARISPMSAAPVAVRVDLGSGYLQLRDVSLLRGVEAFGGMSLSADVGTSVTLSLQYRAQMAWLDAGGADPPLSGSNLLFWYHTLGLGARTWF